MRFVFALLFSCVGASAQVIVAESITGEAGETANRSIAWGQTFTPDADGTLESISFYTRRISFPAPPNVTVSLYAVGGGAPTAVGEFSTAFVSDPIATKAVATASLASPGVYVWLSADFSHVAYALEAGRLYSFVPTYPIVTDELLYFSTNGGYPGGAMIYSVAPENGFAVHSAGTDLAFKVAVIPEPAGYAALVGLGILATAWQRRRGQRPSSRPL